MKNQKIKRIIYIMVFVIMLASNLYFVAENYKENKECKVLYQKEHLTPEDLNVGSNYNYSTIRTPGEEGEVPPEEVRYKKLYGVEYIGKYEINKDEGIKITFLHGDSAKILILDKDGNERFYDEVSELDFEPEETGEYDVYIVGDKFTGRVAIKIYKCE
jgi:hypothetical protein